MSDRTYHICRSFALTVALLAMVYLSRPNAAWAQADDNREIIRIKLEDIPPELKGNVDTCAIDRESDGDYAVFFVSPEKLADLEQKGVTLQRQGLLFDHLAQFAPLNTLTKKLVPSLEPLRQRLNVPLTPARQVSVEDSCDQISTSLSYNEYHSLEESVCFIQNLASAYPHITELVSIGQSVEGRNIWALKITDHPDVEEPQEERILFTGLTHASEWITHEMMLYMAEYLTSRYSLDAQVQHLVDNSVIWLVPVVNPDGYEYTWTTGRAWRKNRRDMPGTGCEGVDINRNYDYQWGYDDVGSSGDPCGGAYRGPSPASEPETQAIQNLLGEQKFAIAVSYHAAAQWVIYPWGYTVGVAPESRSSLQAMGKRYADLARQTHGEAYVYSQSFVYHPNGIFDDYAYGVHGTLAFTVELRPSYFRMGGFSPPEDLILPNNEENMVAALWLMRNVADATEVSNPASDTLLERPVFDENRFSLPLTPVNQKPEFSLGLPPANQRELLTWLDDFEHQPPRWGTYANDFEGCGTGSGYLLYIPDRALLDWANDLTSYKVLPYILEDGSEVALSTAQGGLNTIGISSLEPVRMRDIRIRHRWTSRSALDDMYSTNPWIDWNWEYVDSSGVSHFSHPTGADGASEYVLPFRAYNLQVNVSSSYFGGTSGGGGYRLIFRGTADDCNLNGVADARDIADGTSTDCNVNHRPDECEPQYDKDCNENGTPDFCDLASGTSPDLNLNGVPDECDPSARDVIHVDDDSNGDPLPGIPDNDHLENGSETFPYDQIQQAIDVSFEGAIIVLADGVYTGYGNKDLDFRGKNITVRSQNGSQHAIIDCQHSGRGFYLHSGETSAARVEGLTVTNGLVRGAAFGGGILCFGASPTISNCIIANNRVPNAGGGGIALLISTTTVRNCVVTSNQAFASAGILAGGLSSIVNCTISNNRSTGSFRGAISGGRTTEILDCLIADNSGGGVRGSSSDMRITGCTIVGNTRFGFKGDGAIRNSIIWGNVILGDPSVTYSDVQGGQEGEGNIDIDPLFVDAASGNYHLSPGSPCIDSGDPNFVPDLGDTDLDGDPRVLFGAVDIGADEAVAFADCNGNGLPDGRELLDGTAVDCNGNHTPDACDLAEGTSQDCDDDGRPDECQEGYADCNNNGVWDECDIASDTSADCTANGVPDECEPDCNDNQVADSCDIARGTSEDCNRNGIPDECRDLRVYLDCNANDIPDDCDITRGISEDCNENGIPDECDVADDSSWDCNDNGVPDECEELEEEWLHADLDGDGVAETCLQRAPNPRPILR